MQVLRIMKQKCPHCGYDLHLYGESMTSAHEIRCEDEKDCGASWNEYGKVLTTSRRTELERK